MSQILFFRRQHKKMMREQLDATLSAFARLRTIRPATGWIRAIRQALGMTGEQYARRLNVTQERITALENAEASGAVTLKTLQKAAEALDCVLVYALVPRASLAETIQKEAERIAVARLKQINLTMALEDQALSPEEVRAALEAEINRLIETTPKDLWNGTN